MDNELHKSHEQTIPRNKLRGPGEWEGFKKEIHRLYIQQGYTLSKTQEAIEKQHGFKARLVERLLIIILAYSIFY